MLYIGSHVGFKKNTQLLGSLDEALSYQENTFMFYTGAPQNTARYPIDRKLTEEAWEKMKEQGMDLSKVIVHAPYIVNLANDKDMDKFRFSVRFLEEELKRCSELGISYMVLITSPYSIYGLKTLHAIVKSTIISCLPDIRVRPFVNRGIFIIESHDLMSYKHALCLAHNILRHKETFGHGINISKRQTYCRGKQDIYALGM